MIGYIVIVVMFLAVEFLMRWFAHHLRRNIKHPERKPIHIGEYGKHFAGTDTGAWGVGFLHR